MLKTKRMSLKLKTALCLLLAMVVGAGVGVGIYFVGNECVEKFYMTQEFADKREQKFVDNFDEYVEENNVKSTDTEKIHEWCKKKQYIYLQLFKGKTISLVVNGNYITEYDDGEISEDTAGYTMFPIKFADGEFNISVIEYSEQLLYTIINILSFFGGVITVFFIVLYYHILVLKRISKLSATVSNIDPEDDVITPDKNDEIGDLYDSVEKMRRSIIYHYQKERQTLDANRELITNMSHDIRTPLTSIIGYNEIMLNTDASTQDMKKYASYSLDKANQLKDMSDKLFKYFLVYDSDDIAADLKSTSATLLIQQIIGEQSFLLQQQGFDVSFKCDIEDKQINTDAVLLKRVFDNVFSNISKYGDTAQPVKIDVLREKSFIKIMVIDYISKDAPNVKGTGIGLKSCESIMRSLGGKFETAVLDDMFVSTIIISL